MDTNFITLTFKLEAQDETNPFTKEQRDELTAMMEVVDALKWPKLTNIFKFKKTFDRYKTIEKEWIEKFEKWGGNCGRLNQKLREIENSTIPGLKAVVDYGKKAGVIK